MTINRILLMSMLSAAILSAQDKPPAPLADLQKEADKKGIEWDTLAKGLETKISRLLPCDTRVRGAIEEVGQASDARLAAERAYLEAAVLLAKQDAEGTHRLAADSPKLTEQMNADLADLTQVRDGAENQLSALNASFAKRTTLEDAQKTLAAMVESVRARIPQAQEQATRSVALAGLLSELDAAYQSRQKALETELNALNLEAARWSDYYSARVARSMTECSITNITVAPTPTPRPPARKKQ